MTFLRDPNHITSPSRTLFAMKKKPKTSTGHRCKSGVYAATRSILVAGLTLPVLYNNTLNAEDPVLGISAILPGNLNCQPIGSESALMASTAVARGDGIDAAWANPAGLGVVRASGLELSGTVYQLTQTRLAGDTQNDDNYTVQIIPTFTAYSSGSMGHATPWSVAVFSVMRANWNYDTALSQERFPAMPGQRYQLDTSCSYHEWEGGISAGMTVANFPLRLGATLGAVYSAYDAHLASMVIDGNTSTSVTGQLTESLPTIHLRPTCGVQYDVIPGFTLGLTARLPGIQVWENGRIDSAFQRVDPNGASYLLHYDDGVAIDWPVPGEIIIGGSWQGTRAGLSAELRWTSSRGGHTVIHSQVPASGTDIAPDGTITPRTSLISDEVSAGDDTLGWAVGGWYTVVEQFRVMGGLWYDPSSADNGDTLFTPMNLYGVSIGTGFVWERSNLLLGIASSWGQHDNYQLLPTLSADVRVLKISAVISSHLAF